MRERLILAASVLALLSPAAAGELRPEPRPAGVTVTGPALVVDGDTLDVGGHRWRLAGIQAPERDERGGRAATVALRRAVTGRTVTCRQRGHETSWNRLVGHCEAEGRDLGRLMIERGHACRWVRYDADGRYAWAPCEVRP